MDVRDFAYDEYADSVLYRDLAMYEKDPANRQILLKLSEQEYRHFEFWRKFAPEYKPEVAQRFLLSFRFMRWILGLTFTIKFLELHEHRVIEEYKKAAVKMSGADLAELERIIEEEREHENYFIGQLRESVITYLGFIALGLADAIVEITGVHAGFLGVTNSTLFAGVSGVIVGFSAAISMGSAAYLQAKQDPNRSPFVSAVMTGVSYIVSVLALAVPYFFTANMGLAFSISVAVGIALVAALTFYSAVVFDRKFLREFLETVALMLGTAAASFVLGATLGGLFDIQDIVRSR